MIFRIVFLKQAAERKRTQGAINLNFGTFGGLQGRGTRAQSAAGETLLRSSQQTPDHHPRQSECCKIFGTKMCSKRFLTYYLHTTDSIKFIMFVMTPEVSVLLFLGELFWLHVHNPCAQHSRTAVLEYPYYKCKLKPIK